MLNTLTLGMAAAALIAAGSAIAQAQQQGGGTAAGPMVQHGGDQGMPMMRGEGHPGMMHGREMMGAGGRGGMGPHMMLMMMALIDTDGSETLSLEEVQAVHARMFQYADTDDDGQLTAQELRAFMHGGGENPAR